MKVKILFNSAGIRKDFSIGWGLSILIDNKVLFDTGEKSEFLMDNINKMKIDLSLIEAVVISHDHWDHTGGLWGILKRRQNINVYACPGFGSSFKHKISEYSAKVFETGNFTRVISGIYSTGEIIGAYKEKNISEQALIIKTEKGISVITGCAHPGIIKMLERVKAQLSVREFYAVLGGFHLRGHSPKDIEKIVKKFVALKIKQIGPTHCSGSDAERLFQEVYKENYFTLKVG